MYDEKSTLVMEEQLMKTAVVFYSFDGNCVFVAEQLKERLNADLVQLQMEDEKKRKGFAKFLWGGGMVFSKKNPPLKPYTFDPAAYDLIIIGVPVWAGSPAPPVRTFLSETSISGKKIALFVSHGGGKGGALKKLKALLPGNEIIAEKDFRVPLNDKKETEFQIINWLKKFDTV
jgi:flavodoxin